MEQLLKFSNLVDAQASAIAESILHPDKDVYIIQERENYYVDDCGFIRSHETLHGIYLNGKKQKL